MGARKAWSIVQNYTDISKLVQKVVCFGEKRVDRINTANGKLTGGDTERLAPYYRDNEENNNTIGELQEIMKAKYDALVEGLEPFDRYWTIAPTRLSELKAYGELTVRLGTGVLHRAKYLHDAGSFPIEELMEIMQERVAAAEL